MRRRQRVLILAHGAGSSRDFLARAFPAQACGIATMYMQDRTGDAVLVADRLLLAAHAVADDGRRPLLGGVSVGAHAAAAACLRAPTGLLDGAVLVMPAWSGPGPADGPTAAAAAEVGAIGGSAVLERLASDPELQGDWVVAELRRAWQDRPGLAAELAAAARGSAPQHTELGALRLPALVVALDDDPVHPIAVARAWADAIPGADLDVIARRAPADDLSTFGRAVGRWARRRLSEPR